MQKKRVDKIKEENKKMGKDKLKIIITIIIKKSDIQQFEQLL